MEKLNILNVELREVGQQLRVIVESVYGIQNLGLSLKKKYLDSQTEKPLWVYEVQKLLSYSYNKEADIDELINLANNGEVINE